MSRSYLTYLRLVYLPVQHAAFCLVRSVFTLGRGIHPGRRDLESLVMFRYM